MEKRFNWRLCALAGAATLLCGLTSLQAHALGLGRVTVQSALGEPLRAEIDIADINAAEASSLRTSVASADVFRAAGMEYSPSVADLQISIQKRADGRFYLRLSSTRAVTEPFVDLILEANWSSGRIVRDYTMLFDPPNLRQSGSTSAAAGVTAPVLPRAAMPAMPAAPPVASTPSSQTRPSPAQAAARPAPAARVQPAKVTPTEPGVAAGGQQLAVKRGDTASKIAALVKPASISLDQMLLALLRSNPDAFIGGNINRLKSGSVLDIPNPEVAGAVSATDASTAIVAQSRNFSDFRRKLAENIPATQTGNTNREAGGRVQAKVEDKAPAAATPDKLTLSKGAVQSKAAAEDKIAKDRQTKEASDRVAELAKNIGDLNKLGSAPAAVGAAAAASTAKGASVVVTKPDALSASVPPALPSSSAAALMAAANAASAAKPAASAAAAIVAPTTVPASATALAGVAQPAANTASTVAVVTAASVPALAVSTPVSAASQTASMPEKTVVPVDAAGKKPAVAAPVPPPEPGLLDELTENPFVLPGLAGLLLLLAGFGFYRYRQRNNPAQVDSSFLESRLQPDSFFGASGGQRIDTSSEGGATGSSLVYSPSQLDAAGDVDPVAEADVYLAYGRDLQAEEILKEALRTTPNRVAIYAKLMEIYAKRRDIKAFEVIARQAFKLTSGEGPEWAYICEMGHTLDPDNVLYKPGGEPIVSVDKEAGQRPVSAAAAAFDVDTMPMMTRPQHMPAPAPSNVDLDLDFSLDDEPALVTQVQPIRPSQPPEPAVAFKSQPVSPFDAINMDMDMDMEFDMDTAGTKPVVASPRAAASVASFDKKAADDALSASGLTFTNEPFAPAKSGTMPAAAVMDHGMLEFDMGSLSLDLDGPTTESPAPEVQSPAESAEGPLETKFALAEEFRTLGDLDGARALAEEVLLYAKGALKSKAQAFLNALH